MATEPQIYTIKDVNKYIRMKMDGDAVLSDVWIRGEISNFTHHSSGHMYFTLKDKDSRLKCVMFASQNARLKFIPREGTKVLARGSITVFERDGAYQFYAGMMQPDGLGSLYLAYEQLKARLEEEGLFANSRKRALPLFPNTIGVITSPTGAAVRDIITTLQRRYPIANVLLYPVQVQGELAAPSIVKALRTMNREQKCDILIVGRGGGSLEELWAFNEESVVREIAESVIPVISAVGHETDFTLTDFAADMRAATPTAAAELAVPHILEVQAQLQRYNEKLKDTVQHKLGLLKERLERAKRSPHLVQPKRYLLQQAEKVDFLEDTLKVKLKAKLDRYETLLTQRKSRLAAVHPGHRIALMKKSMEHMNQQLQDQMERVIEQKKLRCVSNIKQLDALSPLKVMARGYSLVYEQNGQLLKSVKEVAEGEQLKVQLSDGSISCQVQEIKGDI